MSKSFGARQFFIARNTAKQHQPVYLQLLKTVPGIGKILSLTLLYEIGDIDRFETVPQFASYCRLIV